MKFSFFSLLLCGLLACGGSLVAQEEVIRNRPGGEYLFRIDASLDATPVKDQGASGTCWSFSTLSFFESELLRMGKGVHDLSEMYIVRHIWPIKADQYVRMQGSARLTGGGLFHDVHTVSSRYGMVPEEAYSGKLVNSEAHQHAEMEAIITKYCEAIVTKPNGTLSIRWADGLQEMLDAYLGEVPDTFSYRGETYTPMTFAQYLDLRQEDYFEVGSFAFQPYYQRSVLMVPDNWDHQKVWNVPLDDLVTLVDTALARGFTVAWDADVSEPTFAHRHGVAIIPLRPWAEMSSQEKEGVFQRPQPEMVITEQLRQAAFDDQSTTDDHLMHITGVARDQNGTKYYLVKNSWGAENSCGGYLYVSEAYFRYKTIHVMVHREGLPAALTEKLR